jgi:hypothetical protein
MKNISMHDILSKLSPKDRDKAHSIIASIMPPYPTRDMLAGQQELKEILIPYRQTLKKAGIDPIWASYALVYAADKLYESPNPALN